MTPVTMYTVTAARDAGQVWVFQCPQLASVISFGANLTDVYEVMPGLIADAAGVDEATVEINLVVRET